MTADDYLRQGDLKSALEQLQAQIKSNPAKVEYRVFMFQLLAVMGQWEKALTQLNVAGEMDAATLAMVVMYRQVVACERIREGVFGGKQEPIMLGQPQEWLALQISALKLSADGKHAQSQALRAQAFEQAAITTGQIDGVEFAWLADSDARLGPICEAIIEGRYLWVPWEYIKAVHIDLPSDLRDIVWLPAHFTWRNGGEQYGLIPARYPFSYDNDDPQIALSRKTVWENCGTELYLGFGQKVLTTDVTDYPIMDVRSIVLNVETGAANG